MNDKDELLAVFCKETNPRVMEQLFSELFTPHETKDAVLRWKLMKRLYEGKTQRDIAAELGISLCKITRGSKILKQDDSAFKTVLRQIYKENSN